MPGGTCEATVYDVYGFTAGSICVALGNYHNMDREKMKIGPEYGGCPGCGLPSFFRCSCGNLMCFAGGTGAYACAWCGEKGNASPGVRNVQAADSAG